MIELETERILYINSDVPITNDIYTSSVITTHTYLCKEVMLEKYIDIMSTINGEDEIVFEYDVILEFHKQLFYSFIHTFFDISFSKTERKTSSFWV